MQSRLTRFEAWKWTFAPPQSWIHRWKRQDSDWSISLSEACKSKNATRKRRTGTGKRKNLILFFEVVQARLWSAGGGYEVRLFHFLTSRHHSPNSQPNSIAFTHHYPVSEHHFIVPTHNYPHSRPHSDKSAHLLPAFRTQFRYFNYTITQFPNTISSLKNIISSFSEHDNAHPHTHYPISEHEFHVFHWFFSGFNPPNPCLPCPKQRKCCTKTPKQQFCSAIWKHETVVFGQMMAKMWCYMAFSWWSSVLLDLKMSKSDIEMPKSDIEMPK